MRRDWWLLAFIVFFMAGVAMADNSIVCETSPCTRKYNPETINIPPLLCKSIHNGEAQLCIPLRNVMPICGILTDAEAYNECVNGYFVREPVSD
jgi:hypothetical protein